MEAPQITIAGSILSYTLVIWLLCTPLMALAGSSIKHGVASAILFAGGAAMVVASILGWQNDITWDAPRPLYLAVAPLSLRLDPLAAVFIALLATITMAVAMYSPGYLPHIEKKTNAGCYWAQVFLFIAGMIGTLVSANALSFLVFWETMALSSALLVASDLSNREAKKAAFIYLGATRISTTLIMTGFLWMNQIAGTWNFSAWHFSEGATFVPALLIMAGLCIKAGIWPFHGWLPYAHPAAPSPVSALMSGVMIKVAIYAIIRLLVMGGLDPLLTYVMLGLGVMSAVWGVLCALVQHDLKTLLAFSSIENVGLVLTGVALALIAQHHHLPLIASIALASAVFHSVNHGLFKSLLFLGTGSIDCGAHTRDLAFLGGLGKRMPLTMILFVIGSAAICSLPPLNGFASKWLLYQSLFQLVCNSGSLWIGSMAIACIALLALVSGMALYCFTSAVGMAFLGRARTANAEHAQESTKLMLFAQAFLGAGCLLLGIGSPIAVSAIQPVCSQLAPAALDLSAINIIPLWAFALLLVTTAILIYNGVLRGGNKVRKYITWECGFGNLTQRMQGTAASFTENVAFTFAPIFEYHIKSIISGRDRRHFPERVSLEVHMTAALESHVYGPLVKLVQMAGDRMQTLQGGSVHLYLGYMLITMIVLMVIGIVR
jgi:hydrogenase-4 component B